MECQLSDTALRYIEYSISQFLDKGTIVTNRGTSIDEYEKSIKKVRKMTKDLHKHPEKYLISDIPEEEVEKIEQEAESWKQKVG